MSSNANFAKELKRISLNEVTRRIQAATQHEVYVDNDTTRDAINYLMMGNFRNINTMPSADPETGNRKSLSERGRLAIENYLEAAGVQGPRDIADARVELIKSELGEFGHFKDGKYKDSITLDTFYDRLNENAMGKGVSSKPGSIARVLGVSEELAYKIRLANNQSANAYMVQSLDKVDSGINVDAFVKEKLTKVLSLLPKYQNVSKENQQDAQEDLVVMVSAVANNIKKFVSEFLAKDKVPAHY